MLYITMFLINMLSDLVSVTVSGSEYKVGYLVEYQVVVLIMLPKEVIVDLLMYLSFRISIRGPVRGHYYY